MTYAIEKKIPVPRVSGRGGRRYAKYPFAQMRKGDSFAVPFTDDTLPKVRGRLSVCATTYAQRNGGKFTLRTLKDDGVIRVWRVK